VDIRTAASVLGHASPTVTLTTYAHLIAGAQAKAVATVEDRLRERS
jgi:integrase